MKEEALKLADELDALHQYVPSEAPDMIRRLVEELDKQKYQNELLENSIKFAMLANNLQDKQGEPVAYWDGKHFASKEKSSLADIPLYTTPQTKPLSDDVLNKAFDYYCETDEGVLRFDYELRDSWKRDQLKRWKEAFRKAWD